MNELPSPPGRTASGEQRHGQIYDVIAIGLGPFNLGLAALAEPVAGLDVVVLEQRPAFRWHPGMMIGGARIQVPFLADLVTMADPTSQWSFLRWLKHTGRLYRFYMRENFHPLRAEYDAYCRWVAQELPGIRYGRQVTGIEHDANRYVVTARTNEGSIERLRARHIVVGIGTDPVLPASTQQAVRDGATVLHTSDYLTHQDDLTDVGHVTVVGSGQSSAEVYRDLLDRRVARGAPVDWVTRSGRFYPMEYTRLTLEMTSPEYVRYFHGLSTSERDRVGRANCALYKGISGELVDDIHESLYRLDVELGGAVPTRLLTNSELVGCELSTESPGAALTLSWRHTETHEDFTTYSDALVCGTGYRSCASNLLEGVRDRVHWDEQGRLDVALDFTVDDEGTLFVQNAEEHTHGLSAPDLGMGAWRNAQILNAVAGRAVYPVEQQVAFQSFGAPEATR